LKFFIALLVSLSLHVAPLMAEGEPERARASLGFGYEEVEPKSRLAPVLLTGGSRLTLISPDQWVPLAKKLSAILEETHRKYADLFGSIPPHTTTLRLMESENFYKESGAPRWTNAMYYRGEITIPLSLTESVDLENLYRSVKHEYTHAVINALSGSRCPGWLDEGLAQWAEGTINPALEPALRNWVLRHPPVPFKLLQGGFTRLDPAMVPPAYGQSLYAAQVMMDTFGLIEIGRFLGHLREGKVRADAFELAFSISESSFEDALAESLKKWARQKREIPH